MIISHLDTSPRFWRRRGHICRKWQRIIFASRWALHLQLFCAHRKPVLKSLDCWPNLPIVLEYGGSPTLYPPASEDDDNIVAALQQSGRVSSIQIAVTLPLLEKISLIEEPFSNLELCSFVRRLYGTGAAQRFLVGPWGPRLRSLHMTRIAFRRTIGSCILPGTPSLFTT